MSSSSQPFARLQTCLTDSAGASDTAQHMKVRNLLVCLDAPIRTPATRNLER